MERLVEVKRTLRQLTDQPERAGSSEVVPGRHAEVAPDLVIRIRARPW